MSSIVPGVETRVWLLFVLDRRCVLPRFPLACPRRYLCWNRAGYATLEKYVCCSRA